MIALDFSLANLTFDSDLSLHSTNSGKANDYRDIMKMICSSYPANLNIPIFGYSAKTSKLSTVQADLFPLSKDLRNPFIPNDEAVIDEAYSHCLQAVELSSPIKLAPFLAFAKRLGTSVRAQITEGKLDSFYVLYILSAGLIDDL